MGVKYHIGKNGKVGECHASIKDCPWGGSAEHFSDYETALRNADKINEAQFLNSVLSIAKNHWYFKSNLEDGMSLEEQNKLLAYLNPQYKIKKYGLKGLLSYVGLEIPETPSNIDNSIDISSAYKKWVTRKKKIYNKRASLNTEATTLFQTAKEFSGDNFVIHKPEEIKKIYPEKYEELKQILKEIFPNSQQDFPAKVVIEGEGHFHIWGSDTNYSDIYTYEKGSKKFFGTEAKCLINGAQISSYKMAYEDGELKYDENDLKLTPEIKDGLEKYNPKLHWNSNLSIPISNKDAIKYFMKKYEEMNCSRFSFTAFASPDAEHTLDYRKFEFLNPMVNLDNLSDSEKEEYFDKEAQKWIDSGIEIKLKIRTNLAEHSKKVTKKDKEYFMKEYGDAFIDGIPKETFTVRDLTKNLSVAKFTQTKRKIGETITGEDRFEDLSENNWTMGSLRIGEFSIRKKILDEDTVLHIDDFKRLHPILTGDIDYKKTKDKRVVEMVPTDY